MKEIEIKNIWLEIQLTSFVAAWSADAEQLPRDASTHLFLNPTLTE